MTNNNYIKHLKVLGKLAYLYDSANASSTAMTALRAVTLDQASTGLADDLPASDLIARFQSSWASAITGGADSLKTLALTIAENYMRSEYFTNDLTTVPTSNAIAHVIAALETEMGAGVDDVTLSTESSTGLVNFFDTLKGSEGTWNTESDSTADYKDSVYVVSTIVS